MAAGVLGGHLKINKYIYNVHLILNKCMKKFLFFVQNSYFCPIF